MRLLIFPLALLMITLTACPFSRDWTEEERAAFRANCAATDSVTNIVVQFRGFRNEEFDSVLVREYSRDSVLVDTFKLYVWPAQSPGDIQRKNRSARIDRWLKLDHTYAFCAGDRKPFILSDLQMVMWSQYTMDGEGWGCVMGDYKIDGEHFEHDANPTFVK